MPLLEAVCQNEQCRLHGLRVEHFYPHSDSPTAACESCGGPTQRVMSSFGIVFTGDITDRYLDRGLEHKTGAHWAWGRDPATKKPVPRRIETFDDQRNFCREFHVQNPKDMPRNLEVSEDGKTVKSSMGMPGCEV